jgi:hypothetical protein
MRRQRRPPGEGSSCAAKDLTPRRPSRRAGPLTRVSRHAFGYGGGPSPLKTGTVSRPGLWLRIALPSEATMGLALFVA